MLNRTEQNQEKKNCRFCLSYILNPDVHMETLGLAQYSFLYILDYIMHGAIEVNDHEIIRFFVQ